MPQCVALNINAAILCTRKNKNGPDALQRQWLSQSATVIKCISSECQVAAVLTVTGHDTAAT